MAITKHYLLPERYSENFRAAKSDSGKSISLEDFTIGLNTDDIEPFPSYQAFLVAWEGSWQAFFDERRDRPISQKEVFGYCSKLVKLFGINT